MHHRLDRDAILARAQRLLSRRPRKVLVAAERYISSPTPDKSFRPRSTCLQATTMSADTVEPELVPAQESAPAVPEEPSPDATASSSTAQPAASVTRTNTLSKMRSHRGNIPTLPQTKLCHLCPAKFTRTTHLNRHLKTRE